MTKQLLAIAGLQLRLGMRPLVRIAGVVLAAVVILDVAARLAIGEAIPALPLWRLILLFVLSFAFLAGIVRGVDEARAQAVLCPVLVSRRAFVLTGVIARTAALVAVTVLLSGLGRLLSEPRAGGDWGARVLLLLICIVEIAMLTTAFSLILPGEANAVAAMAVLAGAFLVLVNNQRQSLPYLLTVLFPFFADPGDRAIAAAGAGIVIAVLAAIVVLAVRERA